MEIKTKHLFIEIGLVIVVLIGVLLGLRQRRLMYEYEYAGFPTVTAIEGKIVFESTRGKGIGVYLLADGKLKSLTEEGGVPVFSNNGKKIMYRIVHELYIINTDGSGMQKLSILKEYKVSDFDWSPDGKKVVFSSDMGGKVHNLYTIDIDGSNLKQLTKFQRDRWWIVGYPRWSPDGRKIVFEGPKYWEGDLLQPSIYIIDGDGSNMREILGDNCWDGVDPSWSPDGEWIVFMSHPKGEDFKDVYVVRPDGSDLRRVTHNQCEDRHPCFSPDGKKIVYVSKRRGIMAGSELFVINIDGTGEARLTMPCRLKSWPYWSTDDYPDWKE